MKKIIFLLPPSEGKNKGGEEKNQNLNFDFEKPNKISIGVSEKDLKCKGDRFLEGLELNKNVEKGPFLKAINRYSGVMYNAIDYNNMTEDGKNFFEKKFIILSGMYGKLTPKCIIGNYKLPIETKGLYKFWGDKITHSLTKINPDYIVNLLPISYSKMVHFDKISPPLIPSLLRRGNKIPKIININFLTKKDGKIVKISHGVKKIKGEWIKNICENSIEDYNNFGGEVIKDGNVININIMS